MDAPSQPRDRKPMFYNELRQTNEDLINYLRANQEKSPYFDFTNTLESYVKQISDLKKEYPPGETVVAEEQTTEENDDPPPPKSNLDKYEEVDVKFQCRCKLYEKLVSKKDGPGAAVYLGCGELYVKDMDSPGKLHVVIRQDPDLRKVLLNQVISENVPVRLLQNANGVSLPGPLTDDGTTFHIAKVKDARIAGDLFKMLTTFSKQ